MYKMELWNYAYLDVPDRAEITEDRVVPYIGGDWQTCCNGDVTRRSACSLACWSDLAMCGVCDVSMRISNVESDMTFRKALSI